MFYIILHFLPTLSGVSNIETMEEFVVCEWSVKRTVFICLNLSFVCSRK